MTDSTDDPTEPKRGPGRPSPYPALLARVEALETEFAWLEAKAVKLRDPSIIGRWARAKIDARKKAARAAKL